MRKILYRVSLFVLSISSVLLYSCDGDEIYDISGDSSNKVYIVNSGMKSFSLLHTLTKSIADINLNFQLCCTQAAREDLTVSIAIDNSMVDIYNQTFGTSYATVPEDAFAFEKESMTILAGKQKADDNVRIFVKKENLRELTEENYLIPVRVKEVLGDARTVTSVTYAVITTSEDLDNWWDGATPDVAHGAEIREGRENWTAWFTNIDGGMNGSYDMTFDDDENNYIYRKSVSGIATDFIVDLGKVYNLAGFYLNGSYLGSNSYGTIISTSVDGENWEVVGTVTATKGAVGHVMFYVPENIRYAKFFIPGNGSDTRAFIYEFRAYTSIE